MPTFRRDDLELHYVEHGDPSGRPVVLLHGLLLSSPLMERLADGLADHRVLLLDLHGHGQSSRPHAPERYSIAEMAADVLGLLDHLELDRAVVGGLSLGANVTWELALTAPERLDGIVLEMPVLGRGFPFGRRAFGLLAKVFRVSDPVLRLVEPVLVRLPIPGEAQELGLARDVLVGDHVAQAALLEGLLREEPPIDDEETLSRLVLPALVVGHHADPLHVFADAEHLARHLPNGELVEAHTIVDFRLFPDRLAKRINRFIAEIDG